MQRESILRLLYAAQRLNPRFVALLDDVYVEAVPQSVTSAAGQEGPPSPRTSDAAGVVPLRTMPGKCRAVFVVGDTGKITAVDHRGFTLLTALRRDVVDIVISHKQGRLAVVADVPPESKDHGKIPPGKFVRLRGTISDSEIQQRDRTLKAATETVASVLPDVECCVIEAPPPPPVDEPQQPDEARDVEEAAEEEVEDRDLSSSEESDSEAGEGQEDHAPLVQPDLAKLLEKLDHARLLNATLRESREEALRFLKKVPPELLSGNRSLDTAVAVPLDRGAPSLVTERMRVVNLAILIGEICRNRWLAAPHFAE